MIADWADLYGLRALEYYPREREGKRLHTERTEGLR